MLVNVPLYLTNHETVCWAGGFPSLLWYGEESMASLEDWGLTVQVQHLLSRAQSLPMIFPLLHFCGNH